MKKVAPPKATGGGGFVFEDRVAAYFLSFLLSGRWPLDPRLGIITGIDFQTRADGWFLDDILLTLVSDGETRCCALSVRSNQQFTRNSAPSEFVQLAWRQFLHIETDRFDKDRDLLGLAIAPLSQGLGKGLLRLLELARKGDPKDLPVRLKKTAFASITIQKLFDSFVCPAELAEKHGITNENTGELLRCIEVLEFSFESGSRTQLREAVENCRSALRSGSPQEALSLWESLLAIASEYRPNAGYLDGCRLGDKLRLRFRLKEFPHHEADWRHLLEGTRSNLAALPDKIGGTVTLPRNKELAELDGAFSKDKAVVLHGPSGCGKTVIAKWWAERELNCSKVLWWNAASLGVQSFDAFERTLGMNNPLAEVLAATPDARAYLILDGLDRCFSEDAFRNVSVVIRTLRLDDEASPWRLLVTSQPEEWKRVQGQLAGANIPTLEWNLTGTKEPDDVSAVYEAFPALQRLALQPQLRSLLLKPKILDLLATKSSDTSIDTSRWVGESDVIEWFWETGVEESHGGQMRAGFLMKLGAKQADELRSETSADAFSVPDRVVLDGLVGDRICKLHEQRVSFYHDLYGDWARQRMLLSRHDELPSYLNPPRLASPLWHRAVRLFALHLLERHVDLTRWRSAVGSLASGEGDVNLGQDLLVEAVIFAANPVPILERLWSDLAANGGLLLRRLLGRFLHVASLPNPIMLTIAETLDRNLRIQPAVMQRIPYWPYWIPMIQFLHEHLSDVIRLAPQQVAEVADMWLRQGGENWPLRREAAELALTKAEQVLCFKESGGIFCAEDKLDEIVYRAALAGARELPERVGAFALKASGRKEALTKEGERARGNEHIIRRTVSFPPLGPYEVELPPPWPDGPSRRPDDSFQNVCLETDALHPLIMANPSCAREVLLGLLIREPRPRDPFELEGPTLIENLDIQHIPGMFSPFYIRGPFLFFLRSQPTEGLEVILRLVNFATERWVDERKKQKGGPNDVAIPFSGGEQEWAGDFHVYYWYRDLGPCPQLVVAALMALEKWFYEEIESGRTVATAIETVLQRSNSVAFPGLLSAVGRKEPSLFQGPLEPLLAVAEFHYWELQYSIEPQDIWMVGWWGQPEFLKKLAQEWHELPHRKKGLHELARMLFVTTPQMSVFFEQARSNWAARLATLQESHPLKNYLETLVALYDIKNYRIEKHPEHCDVLVFEAPEELRARRQQTLREAEERMLLLQFPWRCRQLLDADEPLPQEHLEGFWDAIMRIAEIEPPPDAEPGVICIDDALCGGAAVLLRLHRDWLRQHAEREGRCVKLLINTIHNPPSKREVYIPEDIIDRRWDCFCAEVLPVLWAEDPDSPLLRECVALLAAGYYYKTVGILFARTAEVRDRLGEDFKRLQHSVLRVAAARRRWPRARCYPTLVPFVVIKSRRYALFRSLQRRARRIAGVSGRARRAMRKDDDDALLSVLLRREVRAFTKRTLPATLPTWDEFALKTPVRKPTRTAGRRRRPRQRSGLDLALIRATYAWLPLLDQALNETERAEWISFWKEALGCTLRMLGEDTEDELEVSGTPSDWDHWVLERSASLITQLRPEEQPEHFWQPILELGTRAHYWVESFMTDWFINGLGSGPAPNGFINKWQSMVDFAFSSPEWKFEESRNPFDLERIWCHMMGFDSLYSSLWTAEQKDTVRRMYDAYRRWAKQHLTRPRCAVKFISFLATEAGEPVLFDGLVWVEEAAVQVGAEFWTERDIEGKLADLLDMVWHRHRSELGRHQSFRGAFINLLGMLAERQNPLALELQQRVASI